MSRIGKLPVAIPKGVAVSVEGNTVKVKGPKGELSRILARDITVELENETIKVNRPSDEAHHKALHGLTRTLIANMVIGVTKGYQKQLEISGVGYKAEVRPFGLQLALGFSHPVQYKAPAGIKLSAPQPTQIVIDGADKEKVGQVAAELRSLRPPEPYKGKGIKYVGEQIRRKAGKAGGKSWECAHQERRPSSASAATCGCAGGCRGRESARASWFIVRSSISTRSSSTTRHSVR